MGKVRTQRVKKISRELINRFPDRFNADFELNKKLVDTLTEVSSKRLRNRIAGYVTRLITIKKATESDKMGETEKTI